ncbi:MAG: Rrf2 family transcriptional regulator [Rhodospirillales bacterium]
MQLSKFTDYSLRVLIYLGSKPEGLSTIEEIALRYDISREHLRKIVHNLTTSGVVEGKRGRRGGLRLAMAPADIVIGDIVRQTEENFALVECFDKGGAGCKIAGTCRLAWMLHEALTAFLAVLDRYTLADVLTAGGQPLLERLGLIEADARA